MKKTIYEAPGTRILEVRVEGRILDGSVNATQNASSLNISGWDSTEEDW